MEELLKKMQEDVKIYQSMIEKNNVKIEAMKSTATADELKQIAVMEGMAKAGDFEGIKNYLQDLNKK